MVSQTNASREATVIGAGIVGICCALYLQRQGFSVTLVDRGGPGEGCSMGNAGVFGANSCVPLAMPGALRRLVGTLGSPSAFADPSPGAVHPHPPRPPKSPRYRFGTR